MSNVDNRVVQMEFNNKRFEKNVKTTMSTLDKLKAALSFKKQEQELEELQNASDSFSLGHMESVLDKIGDKFSLFGMVGMNAMQRIASAAVDAGEKVLKSLSIDQVRAGWSKYEEETNAVQTIYSAVKQKGKSIKDVYDVLEDLAAYTDETSYSYSEMVGSMSNFISKGIDMGVAEKAMEGIANAAASAGIGIHDAGMAFRNFADAISSGYMQLRDWRSLKLVHMDTEAFVNEIIEAAKEIGTIDKKTGKLAVTAGKAAKNEIVNIQNFDELLRYGFVNTEVMLKVLQKYADREDEVGKAAFAAAQNAKTFTDVLDAVKDAASTGWKTTFRIIFGELNEAIDFFTPMANRLISIVNSIDEARNSLLTGWKIRGGRDDLVSALDYWWNSIEAVWGLIGDSVKEAYHVKTLLGGVNQIATYIGEAPEDTLDPGILMKWTEAFKKTADAVNSWLDEETVVEEEIIGHSDSLHSIFKGLFSATNIAYQMFSGIATFIGEVKAQLLPVFNRLVFYFGKIGDYISELSDKFSKAKTFTVFAKRLSYIIRPITTRLPDLITKIANLYKKTSDFIKTSPTIQRALGNYEKLWNTLLNNAPRFVEGIFHAIDSVKEFIKGTDEWKWVEKNFNAYIRPIARNMVEFSAIFANGLSSFISMRTSGTNLWDRLKQRFSAFDKIGPWIASKWDAAKQKIPFLQKVENWWNASPFISQMKQFVSKIGEAIDIFFGTDTSQETSIAGKLKARFTAMWTNIFPWMQAKWTEITEKLGNLISEKWEAAKKKYPLLKKVEEWFNTSDFMSSVKDFAERIQNGVKKAFSYKSDGTFFDQVKEKLGVFFDEIIPWFNEQWTKIKEAYPIIGKIEEGLHAIIQFVKGLNVPGMIETSAGIGSGVFSILKTVFSKIGEFLSGIDWRGIFETLKEFISKFTLSDVAKIVLIIRSIVKLVKGIQSLFQIGTTFSNLNKFLKTGTKFLKGKTKNKLTEFVGTFGDTLKNLGVGILAAGAGIRLIADSFIPLAQLDSKKIMRGALALASIVSALGIVYALEATLPAPKIKSMLGLMAAGLALKNMMKVFADMLNETKDIDPGQMLAFAGSMDLITLALGGLMAAMSLLGKVNVGTILLAGVNLAIISAALGAAIVILEKLVSVAIEDFSDTAVHVGSSLSLYSDMVSDLNYTSMYSSISFMKELSSVLIDIGTQSYGNVESFAIALVRTGSAFSIFEETVHGAKFNRSARVTSQIADMGEDLKKIGSVPDVSGMIADIGAALKLFSDNTGGIKIDIGKIPDTDALKLLFTNLAESVPDQTTFAGISVYGTDESKSNLTQFALGLVNLATAISEYQEKIKDLDLSHISKVTEAIDAIASLNTDLEGNTEITANIGAFALSIKTDKPDLTTFSVDIVALGEAVKEFYGAIYDIDTDKLDASIKVIGKIVDLNNALPPTGGLSQWITGEKSLGKFAVNLNTLGQGTKNFAKAIEGATFDSNNAEKAAEVLLKLAKVNQKLPKTGGFISWFAGDESLDKFSDDLGKLGTGVKNFVTNFGKTEVGTNITSALSPLMDLANIQAKLGEGFVGSLPQFAEDLNDTASQMILFNDKIKGVTDWADLKPLESILTLGVGKYNELGANKYEKRLEKLGSDLNDFFDYVEDINQDTYGEAAGIITDIFNALTDINAESFPEAGTAIVAEIATGVTNNAAALIGPGGAIRIVISGAASVAESYETDFYNAGIFFCEGLANGMIDGSGVVMNAAMNVVAEALDAARAEAGQASPWKTTIEMGKFFDYGLANGINNYGEVIERSAKGIVNSALDPIMEELKMVASLPLDELDLSPTIRPVLDADDFIHDVGSLNGLLTRESVYLSSDDTRKLQSIAADLAYANNGNGLSDILKSVNDVGSRLEQMEESIRNMKLILDTGALVGGISDGVDEKIGMKSIMAERGN